MGYAKNEKIEKGRKVYIDCTCIESNIHYHTDSTLLWDAVRVLTRLMERCRSAGVKIVGFYNHSRGTKRRMIPIVNARRKKQRKASYCDLLKTTAEVVGYANRTINVMKDSPGADLGVVVMSWQINHYVQLSAKVINQTQRLVIGNEKVDASENVVSIFEPYTEIIKKDRRDTYYGHKICLSGWASNLILDCLVLEGNPADADLSTPMLDRQKQLYDRYPLKVCFDGGFVSKDN